MDKTQREHNAEFVAECKKRGIDVEEVALTIAGNFPPLLSELEWLQERLIKVFFQGAAWGAEKGFTKETAEKLRAALAKDDGGSR